MGCVSKGSASTCSGPSSSMRRRPAAIATCHSCFELPAPSQSTASGAWRAQVEMGPTTPEPVGSARCETGALGARVQQRQAKNTNVGHLEAVIEAAPISCAPPNGTAVRRRMHEGLLSRARFRGNVGGVPTRADSAGSGGAEAGQVGGGGADAEDDDVLLVALLQHLAVLEDLAPEILAAVGDPQVLLDQV